MLKSITFAQHQSVLMPTELVCLSITIITKKQGRGAPCWEGCGPHMRMSDVCSMRLCVVAMQICGGKEETEFLD